MYERFTDNAREVIQRASVEARRLHHEHLGDEHILLGLLTGGRGAAGSVVLKAFGVEAATVRAELERTIGANPGVDPPPKLPLTPQAQKAIVAAIEAVRRYDSERVETIHILSGLLCEADSSAARILTTVHAPLDKIQEAVRNILRNSGATGEESPLGAQRIRRQPTFTDRTRKVMRLAEKAAQRLGDNGIGSEHLLLGLLDEGQGVAAVALRTLGLSGEQVHTEITKTAHPRQTGTPSGNLSHTPEGQRVIECAVEEARDLNHDYLGTEHLLLGLLRVTDGAAAQVLTKLGVFLEEVRREVKRILTGHAAGEER